MAIKDRSPSANVATGLKWIFRVIVLALLLAGTAQTIGNYIERQALSEGNSK